MDLNKKPSLMTRRELLKVCGGGLGMTALTAIMQQSGLMAANKLADAVNPMAPKVPHFGAKAKSVIWIFINGGPSQVDTWDYKPELEKRHGTELDGFDKHTGFFIDQVGAIMKSPFDFKQYGQSGKWVSSLFPHLSGHVDKMAFIHSMYCESNNHSPALFMMNTGLPRMGFPSVGSWVNYGLGTENQNLPGFVVMSDPKGRGLPKGHGANWTSGFLPGSYQGTWLKPGDNPIDNLKPLDALPEQEKQLAMLARMNRRHMDESGIDSSMEARIQSYELAYRMQSEAPETLDINGESQQIRDLYGVDREECDHFARQCLSARRMVEKGVRFVQIYSGGTENQLSWDGHKDIKGNHEGFALETDRPVAALLEDLEQRGLLDETLVIWGGEFGRLPIAQTGDKPGRDHNQHCNTVWMAGGGVKAGSSYGESDELGFKAAVDPVQVHDLHATLLHLLGIDHKKLTYLHNGRRFRLTDVHGHVLHDIIS